MILVTGATGCLGSNLTKHLLENGERVAIFRREYDPQLVNLGIYVDDVEQRIGDVRDAESVRAALKGIKQLYHLAGIAAPLASLRSAIFDVNVRGTGVVMAAAKASDVERVVFTSSAAAIGIPEEGMVANEDYPYNGDAFQFAYMHSKHQAEAIALRYAGDGLDVVVVNPTAVIAPNGDPHWSSCAAIAAMAKGRLSFVFPSGGMGITTHCDMVDGHVKAMKKGKSGHRYILNTANATHREVMTLIAGVVGARPPHIRLPSAILSAFGIVNSTMDLVRCDPMACSLLSRENARLLTRTIYYDQSKAVRELTMSQTSLRAAVEEVYTSWLEAPNKAARS